MEIKTIRKVHHSHHQKLAPKGNHYNLKVQGKNFCNTTQDFGEKSFKFY
jgi:hypothetical protein